jgi:SAM-dependent methyltransferase
MHHVMSAEALPFGEEFDAVFSNAVLHWIKHADPMIAGVYRSLKRGERFVAECGGYGCVHQIRTALVQALDRRGMDGDYGGSKRIIVATNHGHNFGPAHQDSFVQWEGRTGAARITMGIYLDYPIGRPDTLEYAEIGNSSPT